MKKLIKLIISAVILIAVSGLLFQSTADRSDEYYKKVRENLELFREVYREVSTRYVDDIDPQEFIRAGIRGMLETLDPYTVFITEDGADDLKIMTEGQYGGIGTVISIRGEDKTLTIISPMEGTPADRLGLRAGDQILQIDSVSTEGFDTSRAAKLMRGDPGTEVHLKIKRPGVSEILDYLIVREIINVKDVSTATVLDDKIGYIRLARFSRKADQELEDAIKELKKESVRGLILDLRGNPGGLLESAIEVSQKFVSKGSTIVSTKSVESEKTTESNEEPVYGDAPMVVLVDGGSASASEIVAGAIQDLDRGVIIGEKTFGKGLVQSLFTFRNGTELKLTTAKYYTPSGRLIQKVDYFGDDNPVILKNTTAREGESKDDEYFTSKGRVVYGGGGIAPDIEIANKEFSNLETSLFRQSMYFHFVNDYLTKSDAETGLNDSSLFNKFRKFVEDKEFTYKTDGQIEIESLKEISAKKGMNGEFLNHLSALDNIIEKSKETEILEKKSEILASLRMEFASRISGSVGRLKASFPNDLQLQKAVEILKNKSAYEGILSENIRADKQ